MNRQMMMNLHKGKTLAHERAAAQTSKMESEAPRESAADIIRRLAFGPDDSKPQQDKKSIKS